MRVNRIPPHAWFLMRAVKGYLVGGAVRSSLMGRTPSDYDIATPLTPDEATEAAKGMPFDVDVRPTGLQHGTITVVLAGASYEVTTYRRDETTDGRHAEVAFTRRMEEDAQRRDLTVNALYADANGTVYDPTGLGLPDLMARRVRFVGDPAARIEEDHLRILRLYRFYADFGEEAILDWKAQQACEERAPLLSRIAGERIWSELRRTVTLPGAVLSLSEMSYAGIPQVLGVPQWNPMALDALRRVERAEKARVSPLACWYALAGPHLPFPAANAERAALETIDEHVRAGTDPMMLGLRCRDGSLIRDILFLQHAGKSERLPPETSGRAFLGMKERLPVTGHDFLALGVAPGPEVGVLLRRCEEAYAASDLTATKEELLQHAMRPN